MEEVKIETNKTERKIYVNGFPDVNQIPAEVFDLLIFSIENSIEEMFENKRHSSKKKQK